MGEGGEKEEGKSGGEVAHGRISADSPPSGNPAMKARMRGGLAGVLTRAKEPGDVAPRLSRSIGCAARLYMSLRSLCEHKRRKRREMWAESPFSAGGRDNSDRLLESDYFRLTHPANPGLDFGNRF